MTLKVVVYERWSLTRVSKCSELKTFGVLENWSLRTGGRLREVVATGGLTVAITCTEPALKKSAQTTVFATILAGICKHSFKRYLEL